MPCKKYLSSSAKRRKKKKEIQASGLKLPKISPSNKTYVFWGARYIHLLLAFSFLVTPLERMRLNLPAIFLKQTSRRYYLRGQSFLTLTQTFCFYVNKTQTAYLIKKPCLLEYQEPG
jgi:hypothetical protein